MCLPFRACCCCISVEVGTQVISVISLILSTILLLVYGSAAAVLPLSPYRTWMYSMQAANAGLHLLVACMFAYGAFTKRRRWLLPWVVVVMMSSIILLLFSVAGVAAMILSGRVDPHASYVISAYAMYAVLEYYMACVVWSRHRELQQEDASTESAHTLLSPWKHV